MTLDENFENDSFESDSDNSETLDTEPTDNVDNSETQEDKEPDTEENQGKFSSLEESNKAYAELEKKLGEQSNELGELRKQAEAYMNLQKELEQQELAKAQEKGFDSIQEWNDSKEIAQFRADELAKHLNVLDYPDEMIKLLAEYRENPSEDLYKLIRDEFPIEVLEDVAEKTAVIKGQLQQKQQEALNQQAVEQLQGYLEVEVPKYAEELKNPAVVALFAEGLTAYGTNLQTDKFFKLLNDYKTSILQQAGIQTGINDENSNDTDELTGITSNKGSANPNVDEKNVLDMSDFNWVSYF